MPEKIKNIIILLFSFLVVLINVCSYFPEYNKALVFIKKNTFGGGFGLIQKWNMFAPNPAPNNAYTLVMGELSDGRTVELKMQRLFSRSEDLNNPPKIPIGHNYLSYYLGYLGTFMTVDHLKEFSKRLMKDVANYYVNQWYESHSERITKVYFIQVIIEVVSPGKTKVSEVNLMHVEEM